jgi:hypothetical protein
MGETPDFDGATYEPEEDQERLTGQMQRVTALMQDGKWRTLAAISTEAAVPITTVGSRVRDLRKQKHGGWVVASIRVPGGNGLWEYRMNGEQLTEEQWAEVDRERAEKAGERLGGVIAGYRHSLEEANDIIDRLRVLVYDAPPATLTRDKLKEILG